MLYNNLPSFPNSQVILQKLFAFAWRMWTANDAMAKAGVSYLRYSGFLIGRMSYYLCSSRSIVSMTARRRKAAVLSPTVSAWFWMRSRLSDSRFDTQRECSPRLWDFTCCVGIRRAEYAALHGSDLVYDESGYLCVLIRKGKGGKRQLQRIPLGCEQFIKQYFNGKEKRSGW